MKKLVPLAALLCVLLACNTQKPEAYQLKGNITGLEEGQITIGYYDFEARQLVVVDSAQILNGQFEMEGKTDFPQQLHATINPINASFSIWLENDEVSIDCNVDDAKPDRWGRMGISVSIVGGAIQAEQEQYDALLRPIIDEQAPFSEAYNKANMAYMKGMKAKLPEDELKVLKEKAQVGYDALKPFSKRMEDVNNKYINNHPSSYITASILKGALSHMPLEESKKRYAALSDEIKASSLGQGIYNEIKKSEKGAPGSLAAPFAKNDIHGEPMSLADFKGQYVLLDFWASWCKPCRAGNPHLIQLYNKYHDKGIEFIGIAGDDGNEVAWHKAVKEDEIGIWRHVLNGDKRKGESIGNDYAVHTLPTKVLIDPNGKIIGRFAADGETDEDMDKIFKKLFED